MCHIIGIEPQFKNITENGSYIPMTAGQRNQKDNGLDEEDVSSNDNDMTEVKALKLSKAEGFIFPNNDTGRILSAESQVKISNPLVATTDSLATKYDSADESSVCSTHLPPLEKLTGVEPIYGPKTIKLILKSNSTFKPETSKGVTINKPFLALAKDNKNVSASKRNSTPTGKLKNVKIKDDIPLSIHLKSQGGTSSRYKTLRPSKPFPPCIHCGFNDHLSDDCVNYPIYDSFGSYDHDTHGHNRQKPELRPNKDFEAKYNKLKAKLALISSGTSSKSSMVKNKGLVAEAYE
ncbi:hypothetical protein Tco_0588272 [Tanacetum coccineum]